MSRTGGKKLGNSFKKSNKEDLAFMGELLEAGKVVPVIDRRYPLSEVPEALRYLGEVHARGKVVINLEHRNIT
jgi:NADPH:quinone reductase-like Zn-dependent oxidoreductase